MLCEIWAHEWRVVRYHFSSLCDFWERLLFLYKAAKPKNLMKATWAWFPISLLTVPSFTSEALHRIVWLPTASDPVRLKSFFKQQSSLKDSMEGEMMPSKTEKPTQRNVFQTSWKFPGDQSCDMVTPSQTLFQNSGYDGCLFTICLRKKVKSRVLLTCVFTLGCWDICWEQRYPKTVLEESFTNLLGPLWVPRWMAGWAHHCCVHPSLERQVISTISPLFMSRGREGCGCSSRGGMQIRGMLWMKW